MLTFAPSVKSGALRWWYFCGKAGTISLDLKIIFDFSYFCLLDNQALFLNRFLRIGSTLSNRQPLLSGAAISSTTKSGQFSEGLLIINTFYSLVIYFSCFLLFVDFILLKIILSNSCHRKLRCSLAH